MQVKPTNRPAPCDMRPCRRRARLAVEYGSGLKRALYLCRDCAEKLAGEIKKANKTK